MGLQGGCYCGTVRYEVFGDTFNSTLCHCTDCRKASGAPAIAWFSVKVNGLGWTSGTPRQYRSSPRATRSFCADCGTTLTWQADEYLDEVDIATGSLDDPNALPPADHTYTRSRLAWMDLHDGLPEFQTTRSNG